MKVVAVRRVSTEGQATGGYGPDAQLNDMRTFAERSNIEIVEVITDQISGTVPLRERPGGRKLYKYIGMGRAHVDGILFPRVDRLARDEDGIEVLQLRRDIRNAGLRLFWADRGEADLSGAGGLTDFLQAIIAGADREKIVRNTRAGTLAAVRSGQTMVAARSPYGYEKDVTPRTAHQRRTEKLKIDAAEADIVRKIFKWYGEGKSINDIAEKLSAMGAPRRSDTNAQLFGVRKSNRWSRSTVYGILRNKVYIGEWRYNKRRVIKPKIKGEGKHIFINHPETEHIVVSVPAIISQETFDRAQARLTENKHNTRPPTNTYLLRSFCRCSVCGSHMTGRAHKKGNAYICCKNSKSLYGNERCVSPQFRTSIIDSIVWEWVKGVLADPSRIARYASATKAEDRSDESIEIEARIGQLRVTRANWERMLATGRITEERFDEEVAGIDRHQNILIGELAEIRRVAGAADKAAAMVQTVSAMAASKCEFIETASDALKRELIETLELRFILARNDTHYIITVLAPWMHSWIIEHKRPR